MAFNKIFSTPDEILQEFQRQILEDDVNENESEQEDEILCNSDDNEDVFDCQDNGDGSSHVEDSGKIDRNFELGKDGVTIWTDKALRSKFARVPAINIIRGNPGPRGEARGMTNELELFLLFITNEIIDQIVQNTNAEIDRIRIQYSEDVSYLSNTNRDEFKAFLGLLFMNGVLKNSGLNTKDMFSTLNGPPIFRCTMTLARFQFLLQTCRFDDKSTREERRKNDKFAAFREIWDKFATNCSRYFAPTQYVTVDETMFGFRGRCPFKTYIPSKPDKYGLKLISLCDSKCFYFCGGIPYVGKEINKKKGHLSLPTQYILKLLEPLKNSSRNVTADNWFSSIEVVDELQKIGLSFVGTVRKNKPQIPPSLLTGSPVLTSRFVYQDDKMMVAYTPKKNKKVVLISSMHNIGEINENTNKPEIIEFYNMTKGGVDVMDKLCHSYTTARKTNRWPMRYFYGVLDIAAINSLVIHKWNADNEPYPNDIRSSFLKKLAFALTVPWMEKRFVNQHLPKYLRKNIGQLLGKELQKTAPPVEKKQVKRKRCDYCTNYRKGNSLCTKCDSSLCGEHKVIICPGCLVPEQSDL